MKTCKRCLLLLPLTSFHKKLEKYQPLCKDCRRAVKGSTKLAETLEDYFWRYTPKDMSPDVCWEWTGARFTNDYGVKTYGQGLFKYQHYRMHRVAYELFIGPIATDLQVCHTCDNPPCVNPKHLFLGSVKDNAVDSQLKGRKVMTGRPHTIKNAKLTPEQAQSILAVAYKTNAEDLARQHNVHVQTIYDIWQRRRWSHLA